MNFKNLLKIGIKLLVAVSTGIAIFIGIDRVNKTPVPPGPNSNNDSNRYNNSNTIRDEGGENNDSEKNKVSEEESTNEISFSEKVRNIQNTFSKLLSFAQIITSTVDNISRIFGKNNQYYQPSFGPDGTWNDRSQGKVYLSNGAVLNRISPYIMEIEYTPYGNVNGSPINSNPYGNFNNGYRNNY